MRIRFSEGAADIQTLIKSLEYVQDYLKQASNAINKELHVKSADLYIRIYDEDDTQIEFEGIDCGTKSLEVRSKPYKTAKNVELQSEIKISDEQSVYLYETNNKWD